jgi:hypothetical protein
MMTLDNLMSAARRGVQQVAMVVGLRRDTPLPAFIQTEGPPACSCHGTPAVLRIPPQVAVPRPGVPSRPVASVTGLGAGVGLGDSVGLGAGTLGAGMGAGLGYGGDE